VPARAVDDRGLLAFLPSGRLVSWGAVLTFEIVALRLVYPAAIVLVEQAWAGSAVVLAALSVGLSFLRGWTTDRVTRIVRSKLFDSVSEAIENYPALAPPGSPPVEQLESEIARGVPWVEALVGVTLPAIFGNAVALPLIALLAWVRIGAQATLIASTAMVVGVAVGTIVARKVGALGEIAWSQYQPVARLIESGFRGRVELSVHLRSSAHRARLLAEAASWSTAERRAFVWGGAATWSVPMATALTATALAGLTGAEPLRLLQQIVSHPSRSVVVAGLLALTALPALSSFSRALAEWSTERPHFEALERFVQSASGSRPHAKDSLLPAASPLGAIRAQSLRFSYPVRHSGEAPSVVEADLVWQANETLAIGGANGCGKTTLTWLLMGIIEPEAGTIGIEVSGASHPPAVLAGKIAYLPQQPYFEELETVREAIRFVAPDATDRETEDLIAALLEGHFTGSVQAMLERTVLSLSMGERRAVALARVLLRRSELTILDEPEANLDGELRQRVMNALRHAKSRCRMLIVTHDEAFAAIADRVYRMPPRDVRVHNELHPEAHARPTTAA
jgi:ABC-type multidrug transport system fused ATPase/permease subunit